MKNYTRDYAALLVSLLTRSRNFGLAEGMDLARPWLFIFMAATLLGTGSSFQGGNGESWNQIVQADALIGLLFFEFVRNPHPTRFNSFVFGMMKLSLAASFLMWIDFDSAALGLSWKPLPLLSGFIRSVNWLVFAALWPVSFGVAVVREVERQGAELKGVETTGGTPQTMV